MTDRKLWQIASDPTIVTPRQWEALCLRYIEDLPWAEVAGRMNISDRSAARLVQRALRNIDHNRRPHAPSPAEPSQAVEAHGPMAA